MKKYIIILLLITNYQAFSQVNVLVTYYSQTGKTRKMAESVAIGAKSDADVSVRVMSMEETTPEDLEWASAVVVGSPVYSANIAPQALTFMMAWPSKHLKNKVGAAFTTAGSISAGEEITQVNILLNLLMKGMVVVGGPNYSQPFGASAITREEPFGTKTPEDIAPQFLSKAEGLGKHVAEIAKRMKP